ncbi:MAG: DEAD/DEAH box helicase [Polyangiaceae bacterium]|nr:DEAD/DEAH box helicase [Polyangiaceae bacterium]
MRVVGDRVIAGRGMWPDVRRAFVDPARVERIDVTVLGEPLNVTFRGELRPVQARILTDLGERRLALVSAPPGTGKTALLLAWIAKCGRSALVIVPTIELLRQTAREAERFLGVRASILGDGSAEIGSLTIATPRSALAHVEALGGRFGLLVVDELHLAGADTYLRLFERIDARFRLGLSGTMARPDGRFPLVEAHFGSLASAIVAERADLESEGVLVAPSYQPVPTGFRAAYRNAGDWPGLVDQLYQDDARNAVIRDCVARECTGGVVGLLLCERIQPLERHAEALRARGLRVAVVHGGLSTIERATAIEAARAGDVEVLAGSSVADIGLDIPRLARVFLTSPTRAWPRFVQRIGRICRPLEGKGAAIVLDFVDDAGPLRAQGRARAEAFAREWPSPTLQGVA